jgi:RNA polymerase sigma-70 factor (family 1)
MDDSDLLLQLKQDVRGAFDEIYNRYWMVLYNTAYKRTRNREQCRDAVQNVFIDLWQRRAVVNITHLSAYLHQAVRFQILKALAKDPQQSVFLNDAENLFTSPIYTDDGLKEKEALKLIGLWLETLPEKRRNIFILHYKEGLSTREIAEKLGISQNTVQAQLYTATESLRAKLGKLFTLYFVVFYFSQH